LALARVPAGGDILLEALCFHAQQAAEKSVKAVLVHHGVAVPKTHNLKILLEMVSAHGVVPPDVAGAPRLTDYAVVFRYPGEYEEISEREYHDALALAATAVSWAEKVIARRIPATES
jgi:HEPN domain-containing protein